jgi:hypothetical protein
LLEVISFNQQLLIASPQIIDAIIANPIVRRKRRGARRKSSENFSRKNAVRSKSPTSFGHAAKTAAADLSKVGISENLQTVSSASN